MVQTYYNVFHEAPWNLWIPMYFYFTGLSAGTFILSSLATVFGIKKFKPLAFPSGIMAIALLLIAPLCLILDLGKPFRFWHVLVPGYFNPTSVLSWGSWLLTLYPVVLVIYCWHMWKGNEKLVKVFGIITVPLAIAVHGYTGLVFGLVKARAYWNSAIMPGYFLTSAVLSGIALLIIVFLIKSRTTGEAMGKDMFGSLRTMMVWIIVLDLFWVFCWKLTLLSGSADAQAAAIHALKDPLYLIGEIGMGMLVPLFLLTYSKTKNNIRWVVVSSILLLIGVFLMRYTLVFTGLNMPLS